MFQQFLYRLRAGIRQFMTGRYGTDKLSLTLLVVAMVLSILSSFMGTSLLNPVLTLLSYVLMFWALFRVFSRKTYARYEENRKFLRFFDQLKDRTHRYFSCPNAARPSVSPVVKARSPVPAPAVKSGSSKRPDLFCPHPTGCGFFL